LLLMSCTNSVVCVCVGTSVSPAKMAEPIEIVFDEWDTLAWALRKSKNHALDEGAIHISATWQI